MYKLFYLYYKERIYDEKWRNKMKFFLKRAWAHSLVAQTMVYCHLGSRTQGIYMSHLHQIWSMLIFQQLVLGWYIFSWMVGCRGGGWCITINTVLVSMEPPEILWLWEVRPKKTPLKARMLNNPIGLASWSRLIYFMLSIC